MYRFHLCQTHPKCPDLRGWYLELKPGDFVTLMDVHVGVCHLYWSKFGLNPHIDPSGPYNPLVLAAKWMQSVERFLLSGETVLINSLGGMLPGKAKVLDTVELDKLEWPDLFDDEVITISRWPEGKHYYMSSNRDRIFCPSSHNTYEVARSVALRYVTADRIKSAC